MIVPLFASFVTTLFGLALTLTATFLILLVLVQRGRGGGLAGALGGMGGSSAFGAKAGDIFTRITIGVAAVWIVLCIAAAKFSAPPNDLIDMPLNQGVNVSSEGDSLEEIKPQDTADNTENSSQNEQDSETSTAKGATASSNSADEDSASSGDSASSTESPASPAPDSQSPASP
ncbi:MAG: preprotein translocase subunit SecG [Pirellulales bacterium]